MMAGCPPENLRDGDADPSDARGHVGERFCGACGGRMKWQCEALVTHLPGTAPARCLSLNMVGMVYCTRCGAARP